MIFLKVKKSAKSAKIGARLQNRQKILKSAKVGNPENCRNLRTEQNECQTERADANPAIYYKKNIVIIIICIRRRIH